MSTQQPVFETQLRGVRLLSRGKVRDIYEVGEQLLIISTDRISAFDYVLPNGIPDKGRVLNQLSLFWFEKTRHIVKNHLATADVRDYPSVLAPHADILKGRSMLVRRAEMFAAECVVRGYLAGSGWREYREKGSVSGVELPPGLRESDRLPEPIFTPATKAQSSHDENISFATLEDLVGKAAAGRLRELTLALYTEARGHAESVGVIIADTKFEFGVVAGEIVLADELLTPDSSRFWPAHDYSPGRSQPSFDKQFVRDYLEKIGWDKRPPVPKLPPEIVSGTRDRYLEIFRLLTRRPGLED